MKLKKLLPELVETIVENGFDQNPKEIQTIGMPKIKSGADALFIAPELLGKSTLIVMGIIQQLKKAEDDVPRAVVLVNTKEDAFKMEELFKTLGANTDLRYFTVFDQGNLQFQKDEIYYGVDVVIGTPKRINELLGQMGLPLGGLKIFAIDDAETYYQNRTHTVIYRIGEACPKSQILLFANRWNDNFDMITDELMKSPQIIEVEKE